MLPLEVYYSDFSSYCIYGTCLACYKLGICACWMLGSAEVMSVASLLTIISMQAQHLVCKLIVSKSEELLNFN